MPKSAYRCVIAGSEGAHVGIVSRESENAEEESESHPRIDEQ